MAGRRQPESRVRTSSGGPHARRGSRLTETEESGAVCVGHRDPEIGESRDHHVSVAGTGNRRIGRRQERSRVASVTVVEIRLESFLEYGSRTWST